MGEVIDIRGKLGESAPAGTPGEDGCSAIFRVTLCGPDLHWIGLVGGVLAGALALEGFYTTFENSKVGETSPRFLMRIGRQVVTETGPDRFSSLIVAGAVVFPDLVQRCDGRSVLLAYSDENFDRENRPIVFPGTEVPLFVADVCPDPLEIAAACTGGAARLLGIIRWTELEQTLSQELIFDSTTVNRLMGLAQEAYNRLAPWTGIVQEVPEERV